MAKYLQSHHISYKRDWKVDLTGQQHRTVTTMQRTNASPEQFARWTNFLHAITVEWNRMRLELDTGITLPKQKKPPKKRIVKVKGRFKKIDKTKS